MTKQEAKEVAQQRVFIAYTRGGLEDDCSKYGMKWNVRNCKRRTLEKYLIRKLTEEIFKNG